MLEEFFFFDGVLGEVSAAVFGKELLEFFGLVVTRETKQVSFV